MRGKKRKPLPQAVRDKISAANKGKSNSKEALSRQSETRKRLFREGKIKIPWTGTKGVVTWNKRGKESSSWKGGRYKDKNGYVLLWRHGHPNADSQGRIMEHRLVMATSIGRPLQPWEQVHHVNAIKDDNRIANLLIVSKKVHKGFVLCPHCNKEFAIR